MQEKTAKPAFDMLYLQFALIKDQWNEILLTLKDVLLNIRIIRKINVKLLNNFSWCLVQYIGALFFTLPINI